jgi:ABC-2 type transport system permease protein
MHKVWAVVRREFLERVRNKWFVIATVLGPVFVIAITVLPSLFLMGGSQRRDIVLLNAGAGGLAQRVEAQLARTGAYSVTVVDATDDRQGVVADSLTRHVQGNVLSGYLILTAASLEAGAAEYRGRNVSSIRDMATLEGAVRQSIVAERLTSHGVDPAVVREAQARIDVRTVRITKRGATGESGEASFLVGYIVGLLLYMIILLYGIAVMRSVIEEKQSRIIEVLVSSLKPFQLMLGKVIGVAGVGLFQFTIWGLSGFALVLYRAQILTLFKVPAEAANAVKLPSISAELLIAIAVYFLLGYLLYSALFAVVGAIVNSDSEAQQAQQPVMMLLVFSLIISFSAFADASGPLATTASLVPFSSPIVMPVRVATSDVPIKDLLLSIGILATSSVLIVWVSARIYRIGILMYGKRPNLKELVRWARQS